VEISFVIFKFIMGNKEVSSPMEIDKTLMKRLMKAEQDEANGAAIYAFMARREGKKHPDNAKLLAQMSADERKHYEKWKEYTHRDYKPHVFRLKFLTVFMGFTFVLKSMEKGEAFGQKEYAELEKQLPDAAEMLADEHRHEGEIEGMLDEERLHYVGAMVLGLNDALVELTGAITGVTFSLQDPKTIALTGIVTGIAATLSMMASDYLSESADGNKHALKSCFYTGGAYIVTVFLLVLPYILFSLSTDPLAYLYAFAVMIAEVILEIAFFNYYISVAQEKPFWKHFLLMLSISLGVAAISYGIGILAKFALGIDVG
jgi:VIT1/CCC1 family predicted Fe2+/Mn2+ transporter